MDSNIQIGIDLGGTKIEIIALADQIEIYRKRILTEAHKGSDHIIHQINDIYQQALIHISGASHTLGVCTPGSIAAETGLLRNSNTTCLNGLPLQHMLEDKLGHPLLIENDANCFALAEALMGAGQRYPLVFGVIMGTGCGGGLVYNKQLRHGPNLISGEWGHSILHTNGNPCYCGKHGCVETYISGAGLSKILAAQGMHTSLEAFFQKEDKNHLERKTYQHFINDFAQAMGNVINSIDPDIIILGGGLSNIDALYTDGVRAINEYVFSESLKTPIVRNQLGDSAGVFGAALL